MSTKIAHATTDGTAKLSIEESDARDALGVRAQIWCGVHSLGVDLDLLACAVANDLQNDQAVEDVKPIEIPSVLLRLAGRARALSGYVEDVEGDKELLTKRVAALEAELAAVKAAPASETKVKAARKAGAR